MLEVDLAGAACAFEHDHVVLRRQRIESPLGGLEGLRFEMDVVGHAHVAHRFAEHDYLRTGVGVRLEQDRIYPRVRFDAARLRLDDLCAAHFAAIARDEGVQRHVLRLERCDTETVLQQDAAERGGQHTLAGVGTGALKHDRRCAAFAPGWACPPQLPPQHFAETRVLIFGADGDAEEACIESLEIAADTNGHTVGE